jgi:hypothetical protein
MKTTQAWGWLIAGVLAAGLNASYHNGGLQWAHQVAERVEYGSGAVMALASGRADQFLTEARLLTVRDQPTQDQATEDQATEDQATEDQATEDQPTQEQRPSCRFATTMARVQSKIDRSHATFDRMQAMSERQQARLEAQRARMEARIESQMAHLRITTADFAPVALRAMPAPVVCPRVRVSVPRMPRIEVPAVPVIHVDIASAGPV